MSAIVHTGIGDEDTPERKLWTERAPATKEKIRDLNAMIVLAS